MIPAEDFDAVEDEYPMSRADLGYVEFGEDGTGRQTYRWVILTEWKVVPSA